jgi:hypothetical protein
MMANTCNVFGSPALGGRGIYTADTTPVLQEKNSAKSYRTTHIQAVS